MSSLKAFIGSLPIVGDLVRTVYNRFNRFTGVQSYWEKRYASGGDSGAGSYGKFAAFKAEVINGFVREHNIASVIEYGCGDGNQLKLFTFPRYTGFDISPTAVAQCRDMFAGDTTKNFKLASEYDGETAELTLSLDVIYHLVEDDIFNDYMMRLFGSASRFVIIYSDNGDNIPKVEMPHVRHRQFTQWVENQMIGWNLLKKIPNKYPYKGNHTKGSFADFYIYERAK
jgi:hypothetical protein